MATATAAVLDPDSTTARSALMLMAGERARRRRVVIVSGGFAGFHAARALSRLAKGLDVEVVLVNPTDYFLYLPDDQLADELGQGGKT
jgi:hypothetical protein